MSNVIAFEPRPRPAEPTVLPLTSLDLRTQLEEAAQTALDAADRIIAALDQIDGGATIRLREPPAPIEPEPDPMPQNDPQEPNPVPQEIATPEPIILPWRDAGNVVSAAGCAVLAFVGMRA